LIGSDKSVDTLKAKLQDSSEVIAHSTRMVLEGVGSAKALAALKAAQSDIKGREAEGVAGAIKLMS